MYDSSVFLIWKGMNYCIKNDIGHKDEGDDDDIIFHSNIYNIIQ